MTKKLKHANPAALPNPNIVEPALEALDFKNPEHAKKGHELLRRLNFLGALDAYNKLPQKGQR